MRLRYAEWGDGEDTLLLLHDVAEAAAGWAPVAQRLADRGFRVVAYDLRGMCHSLTVEQRETPCDYSLARHLQLTPHDGHRAVPSSSKDLHLRLMATLRTAVTLWRRSTIALCASQC